MRSRFDSKAKLRVLLGVVLLGLAAPAWLLFQQASRQLELEAFRRQQLVAEETARRIDATLATAIAIEEARPFNDYAFVSVPLNALSNVVQRSPLSILPSTVALPGVIGHFQVDSEGRLTTPLLPRGSDPTELGLTEAEHSARLAIEQRILGALSANRLVRQTELSREPREAADPFEGDRAGRARADLRAPSVRSADAPTVDDASAPEADSPQPLERGQAVFDELAASNVRQEQVRRAGDENFETQTSGAPAGATRQAAPVPAAPVPVPESEGESESIAKTSATEDAVPGAGVDSQARAGADGVSAARVSTFDADLEPYQLSRLDTGHLVLFRNAWRDGARFIQGMLLDQSEFLRGSTAAAFRAGGHAPGTRLFATIGASEPIELTLGAAPAPETAAAARPLHAARLSPPLAQIALSFTAGELDAGPAARVLAWTALVLGSVLFGGIYATYRFGVRQIELTRQHEDFVSAVSHELKTPLTSIRMYGEMLKSGWADEQKKQTYYEYIFAEGERLSRLIDNVLQIARLNRGSTPVSLEPHAVGELVDVIRSKVSTAAERARFELTIAVDSAAREARVLVDQDALVQVFINLVDNAIKFASEASRREIVISAGVADRDSVAFNVRDFGPGIPQRAMKRLFVLFYRPDDDRTRATAGTGIGLALVKQLVTAMQGRVDVRNVDPGAEFRLLLPRADP